MAERARSATSSFHSRSRARRRTCWETGLSGRTNSHGVIAVTGPRLDVRSGGSPASRNHDRAAHSDLATCLILDTPLKEYTTWVVGSRCVVAPGYDLAWFEFTVTRRIVKLAKVVRT